jgi:hypothetical protein
MRPVWWGGTYCNWILSVMNMVVFTQAANQQKPVVFGITTYIATLISFLIGTAVYWFLFLTIAWPLFKDILAYFGINITSIGPRAVFRALRNWKQFTATLRVAK